MALVRLLEAPLPLQLCLRIVFLRSVEFRFVPELLERGAKNRGVEGGHLGCYGLLRDWF